MGLIACSWGVNAPQVGYVTCVSGLEGGGKVGEEGK